MHVQMKFSFEWNNRENDVFVRTLVVLLGIVCGVVWLVPSSLNNLYHVIYCNIYRLNTDTGRNKVNKHLMK